jgi:c-di-GMP-binding flagellar brake protein YcgR
VAIFDRLRRSRGTSGSEHEHEPAPIPAHLLPDVNQRVTLAVDGAAPVPSRVEDVRPNTIQLAFPALELGFGDAITITWEREDAWFSLETRITGLDPTAAVPTIFVAASGNLARFDERRRDVRRSIELPVDLRVVRSRAIRMGRELHTFTTEVSTDTVRFSTSAPFAPGDLVEATIRVGEGPQDTISARMRVIRTDTAPGSWRSSCTATFDEVLRSDRARLVAIAAAEGVETSDLQPPGSPTTEDGIGGRDEPRSLSDLQGVLEWLGRDRSHHEEPPAR